MLAVLRRFKLMYEGDMLRQPGVGCVAYFGPTLREVDWKPGKSDLDVIVYGLGIPGEVKRYGILLIRNLNFELGMRLENVPVTRNGARPSL